MNHFFGLLLIMALLATLVLLPAAAVSYWLWRVWEGPRQ